MNTPNATPSVHRRQVLVAAVAAALPVLPVGTAFGQITSGLQSKVRRPPNVLTVLYRASTIRATPRTHPAIQAAILALDRAFISLDFKVVQPSPNAYALMDRGPEVVLTFSPDAGYTLEFSAIQDLRPTAGGDSGIAEVSLQARVYVGRRVLAAEEARGQMFTRLDPAVREFGERRAMELASRQAAEALAELVGIRLRALTDEHLADLLDPIPEVNPNAHTVPVPAGLATTTTVAAGPGPNASVAAPTPTSTSIPAVVSPSSSTVTVSTPPTSSAVSAPFVAGAVAAPTELPATPPPSNCWALIFGVSDYSEVRRREGIEKEEDLSDLPGVRKDVINMRSALLAKGYPEKQVYALLDKSATSDNVRGVLKTFAGSVAQNDMVVVYLSAHGGSGPGSISGYGRPALFDYHRNRADDDFGLQNKSLDIWELQSLCRNLPCRQVVWVLDTCFAGGATKNLSTVAISASGVTVTDGPPRPNVGVISGNHSGDQHFAIFSAARHDEISLDTQDGGLFTLRFLRALEQSKGQQDLQAIYERYVFESVVSYSRDACRNAKSDRKAESCRKYPQQTPMLAYAGAGNRIKL